MIDKGWILQMEEGGKRAKIKTSEGEILDKVLMLYPYGEAGNIKASDTSLCLLIYPLGSKTNVFAVPYNTTVQPLLEPTEKAVGNFEKGNKITFKANGDVELTGTNDLIAATLANLDITASAKISLSAPDILLGDAIANVLNTSATMQVVVSTGSSAGTYPVTILTAGQTKVKA
tara:strand:- start:4108 stop:4629 length:522 start_codon:yes stop_codon:yes gene_type:complete